ncbi:MAG: hypothetical protein F6K11_10060 [Leptolyngbya sp. SIO3F4]|nr:hypothetical protein [Leptolyngbya sp. SIO3F4]
MSFHHTPIGKGRSYGDFDPLSKSSKRAEIELTQPSPDKGWVHKQIALSETYNEETRFELLSAYIDNEVTPQEKKLVEQWLKDDPSTMQMYRRLLMLRQAIRTTPIQKQPSLEVPSPPRLPWKLLFKTNLRRILIVTVAIALLSSLSQLGSFNSLQKLYETWQFLKVLPQGALLELHVADTSLPSKP